MIKLTNTLTGIVELFEPLDKKNVTLYVCGVTPYDYAHVGHGRAYVTFDLLYRLLQFLGYTVTYCRNYTDIDDKIIRKAEQEFGDKRAYEKITKKFIQAYQEDMKALNCLEPDHEPHVTDNIAYIINFITELIDADRAYVADGDVYFSVHAFDEYGKLSKQKVDDLRAGERVQVNPKKQDPLDFALWKSEPEGQFWKSPWGYGRPGWHIECSALARKFLGPTIDIHGGGRDLIFPHHENEIAQSESLHKPFARFWVHNGFVQINKEKMSKSLGNFLTLQQLFKKYDPMVIRYYFLAHQYGAPIEFAFEDIDAVQKSYQKLCKLFASEPCKEKLTNEEIRNYPIVQQMLVFLEDDLNTPGMLGVVFENIDVLRKDTKQLCAVKAFFNRVLGLTLQLLAEKEVTITPEMEELIKEREEARATKDWKKADQLRDALKELGYETRDKKS